jgi:hypothetical protein
MSHRHTSHGHPCCNQAHAVGHIGPVARCGGPGLCGKCKTERDLIHATPRQHEPAEPTYGELTLTRKMPVVVGEIPERTLMTVELLRSLHTAHLIGPDRICVGEDTDGEPVLYRITGWNAAFSALVLTRCDR